MFGMPFTLPAQEPITVLYPLPAGSWMIPVIARKPNISSARVLLVDFPISAEATFSVTIRR
jgi:hypothetical protein